MQFEQEKFNQFVIDAGVVGFFNQAVKLKSGRTSNWYVNWRHAAADAYRLHQLTDYILAFLKEKKIEVDCVYGVPEGATKTAVITSFKLAQASSQFAPGTHVICMGRAKPKEHGAVEDRYFLGAPRGRTLVLEDVTTTGGSLLQALEQLSSVGVQVVAALGMTHRMEKRDDGRTVEEAIGEQSAGKVPYYSMSRADELLPLAVEKCRPGTDIIQSVEAEFTRYGVRSLSLRSK